VPLAIQEEFQHGGSGEDVESHGVRVQSASREAQFAFCSVALDVLPASSVLRTLWTSHLHGRRDARPGGSYAGAIQVIVLLPH
jgi:hypothetical protein